ncbi:MAG: hypothetical protein PHC36_00095 [Eubacteriales bacterium]|nr:hypothetical protein [Eubacteriales bacterium]MDD4444196.1 hypothetical protein [Eubacteriales bacterium]
MKKTVKSILSLMLAFTLVFAMLIPAYAASSSEAETKATALKQLGLFKGVSDTDFALDRAPTRTEALVMLIRAMGKESEALNGTWSHPFTDVPSWADKYVGYGYEKGLTKGVSATEFGIGNAGSDMYLTFMLRALGYDDSAGDFTWDAPETLAASVGVMPDGVDTANFTRSDVALVSWAALEATLKGQSQTLSQKLMEMATFASTEYTSAKLFVDQAGGTVVSTPDGLQSAVADENITVIQIGSDMDISGELFVDREEGPETLIYIKSGVTLTVSGEFSMAGCYVTNDGTMVISGLFGWGLGSYTNNGTVMIKSGGEFSSGMTDAYNRGTITVDTDGKLPVERGTQFYNYGNIVNNGYISVDNGGSLFNDTGKIENNGTIDLNSYFSGNVDAITGTGTVNDNRQ